MRKKSGIWKITLAVLLLGIVIFYGVLYGYFLPKSFQERLLPALNSPAAEQSGLRLQVTGNYPMRANIGPLEWKDGDSVLLQSTGGSIGYRPDKFFFPQNARLHSLTLNGVPLTAEWSPERELLLNRQPVWAFFTRLAASLPQTVLAAQPDDSFTVKLTGLLRFPSAGGGNEAARLPYELECFRKNAAAPWQLVLTLPQDGQSPLVISAVPAKGADKLVAFRLKGSLALPEAAAGLAQLMPASKPWWQDCRGRAYVNLSGSLTVAPLRVNAASGRIQLQNAELSAGVLQSAGRQNGLIEFAYENDQWRVRLNRIALLQPLEMSLEELQLQIPENGEAPVTLTGQAVLKLRDLPFFRNRALQLPENLTVRQPITGSFQRSDGSWSVAGQPAAAETPVKFDHRKLHIKAALRQMNLTASGVCQTGQAAVGLDFADFTATGADFTCRVPSGAIRLDHAFAAGDNHRKWQLTLPEVAGNVKRHEFALQGYSQQIEVREMADRPPEYRVAVRFDRLNVPDEYEQMQLEDAGLTAVLQPVADSDRYAGEVQAAVKSWTSVTPLREMRGEQLHFDGSVEFLPDFFDPVKVPEQFTKIAGKFTGDNFQLATPNRIGVELGRFETEGRFGAGGWEEIDHLNAVGLKAFFGDFSLVGKQLTLRGSREGHTIRLTPAFETLSVAAPDFSLDANGVEWPLTLKLPANPAMDAIVIDSRLRLADGELSAPAVHFAMPDSELAVSLALPPEKSLVGSPALKIAGNLKQTAFKVQKVEFTGDTLDWNFELKLARRNGALQPQQAGGKIAVNGLSGKILDNPFSAPRAVYQFSRELNTPNADFHYSLNAEDLLLRVLNPLCHFKFKTFQLTSDQRNSFGSFQLETTGDAELIQSAVKLNQFKLSLPLTFPAAPDGGGSFEVKQLVIGSQELGKVSLALRQNEEKLLFDGVLKAASIGGDGLQYSGSLLLPPQSFGFALQFSLPTTTVESLDLNEWFRRGMALRYQGKLAASGLLRGNWETVDGQAKLELNDGTLTGDRYKATGVQGTVELADIAAVASAPDQKLTFRSLKIDDLEIGNGKMLYELRPDRRLAVYQAEYTLFGGRFNNLGPIFLDPLQQTVCGAEDSALKFAVSGLDAAAFLRYFGVEAALNPAALNGMVQCRLLPGQLKIEPSELYTPAGERGTAEFLNLDQFLLVAPDDADLNFAVAFLRAIRYNYLRFRFSGDQQALRLNIAADARPLQPLPFYREETTGKFRPQLPSEPAFDAEMLVDLNLKLDKK